MDSPDLERGMIMTIKAPKGDILRLYSTPYSRGSRGYPYSKEAAAIRAFMEAHRKEARVDNVDN